MGKPGSDDPRFDAQGDFESLSSGLAKTSDFKVEDWRSSIASAGSLLGERWRSLHDEIFAVARLDQGIPDLDRARTVLLKADSCARLTAANPFSLDDSFREPAARRRDLQVHDLLEVMSNRAWLDHWYDEDPAETPYYRRVGKRYLDDAERLVPGGLDLAALRDRFDREAKLALEGPGPQSITTEQSLRVTYQIKETDDVPVGTPVIRAVADPLYQVDGEGTEFRAIRRATEGQAAQPVDFTLAFPTVRQAESDTTDIRPSIRETALKGEGYFRGQVFQVATPLNIDPVAEFVAIGPVPPSSAASLAVRADQNVIDRYGEGTGAIAFVLDCSGSMVTTAAAKFEEAKRALIAALKLVPRGTQIAIVCFGQADDGFSKDFPRDQDRENNAKPERTIRVLRPLSPWNAGRLDELNAQLDALRPFHGTPLVQAMARAKDELNSVKGAKTLIVLTDGKDTRFVENKSFNPKGMNIPSFIRSTFLGSDVRVNMVFFKVVEDELKEARTQFAGAIEHLDVPGKFYTVDDFGKLVHRAPSLRATKTRLPPDRIRRRLGRLRNRRDRPRRGRPLDRQGARPRCLHPSSHRRADLLARRHPGKRGPADRQDGTRPRRRSRIRARRLRRRSPLGERTGRRIGPIWQLSILSNHQSATDSKLDLNVALEPTVDSEETSDSLAPLPGVSALRQVGPGFAWFALEPAEGRGTFQLRFRERDAFPASVWNLDVPHWIQDPAGIGPARPVLKAWWSPSEIAARAAADLNRPLGLDHLEVDADDGSKIIVESIRVEDPLSRNDSGSPSRVGVGPGRPNRLIPRGSRSSSPRSDWATAKRFDTNIAFSRTPIKPPHSSGRSLALRWNRS